MPVTRICSNCGSEYSTSRSIRLRFCSNACYHASKSGSGNPKWRGGLVNVSGYIYQHAPFHPNRTKLGYVCQHRLVMEAHIGRLLMAHEVVHHKNGIKTDNRLENLELCASSGKHSIEHHTQRDEHGRFFGSTVKPFKHGMSKLTAEQTVAVKERRSNGEKLRTIAADFGISLSRVSAIANGR